MEILSALTQDEHYQKEAMAYAGDFLELCQNDGTGDYVLGLVRLHLRLHPDLEQFREFDWSF